MPDEAPPQTEFPNDQYAFAGPMGCSRDKMQMISYT